MEKLSNLKLSKYFREGSQTYLNLKKQEEQTQEKKKDIDASKALRVESLNDLNELVNKRIYQ
jgi:plasmid maintenance system antidote protein VapI